MCEKQLRLQVVLVVLSLVLRIIYAVDDSLLFTVTRAPRYFGILQDHRGQPISVEVSEEYMDQDYIATNRMSTFNGVKTSQLHSVQPKRKRHKIDWNKNPLDIDDFDDDETEEFFDDKDKDVKLPNKYNLQAGPV